MLRQLDSKRANPARAPMNQDGLTRRQPGEHTQIRPHRGRHLNHRGRLFIGISFRNGQQLAGRHRHIFGVAPARQEARNLLANLTVGVARIHDFAGAFQPHDL